jgi:hypothetical protein
MAHPITTTAFTSFDIDANEDSQLVVASLQIWAAHGVNEALAAPILS